LNSGVDLLGVVGGVVLGHAAVGLMFGPGGIVLTLATDAVIGAIGSSVVGGVVSGCTGLSRQVLPYTLYNE
jgi:hypothetical protein